MADETLPDWLRPAAPVTAEDKLRLDPLRRSWASLSSKLAGLSEADLLKIILLERSDQNRPVIITRCLSRFRTKRTVREDGEVFSVNEAMLASVITAKAKPRA